MNYTLRQLQVFQEVAKQNSITKAANSLYLTQPAISIQLKKLESQFDKPLTETIGKRIHLTTYGEKVLEVAKQINQLTDDLKNIGNSSSNQLTGKIKVSSVSTGKYVIPYLISDFLGLNTNIDLTLNVTNRNEVIGNLMRNEIDFAIVSIKPERIQVEKLELFKNELALVVPYSIKANHNDINIFRELPLIYREKGSGTRNLLEKFLSKQKIKRIKRLELQSNEAVKQAVIAGLGMSIIPVVSIKNELKLKQLKVIKMDGLPLFSQWQLVWPKGKKHGTAAKKMLEYIDLNKEIIFKKHFAS